MAKMLVETYEVDTNEGMADTPAQVIEMDAEAVEICRSLELTGQLSLVERPETPPESEKPAVTRLPYRQATKQELFIIKQICPDHTDIKRYDMDPIPLRVLQVAAHARQSGLFDEVYIYHQKDSVEKDPFLIGRRTPDPKQSWVHQEFILARWGEVLESWEVLAKRALAAWGAAVKAKVATMRKEMELDAMILSDPEAMTIALAMEKESGPSYYGIKR